LYARARARETYLLPARCTSARETLHDDSSKACAQLRAGVFRLSRASRRYRRSCPKSRFATFAYPSRGREHEREIPGSASSALMPGTRWCKKKSVAIPFEEGDRFRARVLARTLLYVLSHFYARVRFLLVFFELRRGLPFSLLYSFLDWDHDGFFFAPSRSRHQRRTFYAGVFRAHALCREWGTRSSRIAISSKICAFFATRAKFKKKRQQRAVCIS